MSGNKNTNEFPQTTTTLIDRLRVGGKEDWTEFWKRYERPIMNALRSLIWNEQQLDYNDVEAYIGVVYQRIQKKFSTYVHHGKSQFRGCILTWIRDVIKDEMRRGKSLSWMNTSLTSLPLDIPKSEAANEEQSIQPELYRAIIEESRIQAANREQSIQLELCRAIIKESRIQAANRFPWRGERKEIVNLLAHTDLSVGEIAKRCKTTSQNVSKAEAALKEKAEFYLDGYKSDDYGFWDELYSRFRLPGLDMDEAEKIIVAQIDSMSNK